MTALSMLLPLLLFAVFFGVAFLIHKNSVIQSSKAYAILIALAISILINDYFRNGSENPLFLILLMVLAGSYLMRYKAGRG